jgi:hypothetical protein
MSTIVTAPVRAQIAVMAARGIAAELRWLGPAVAKPAAVRG